MTFYPVLKWLRAILITLTFLCYLYQIIYLILPLFPKKKQPDESRLHRYAVLIAARNEEAVIPHLLDSLTVQQYPPELLDLYVVANNCTDNTAKVAVQHGAQVFQRFNTRQIGKGYALNFLLDQIDNHIGLDYYDAFLIFDADNLLEPDYIAQINRICSAGYDAFCGYRNSKNFGSNWLSSGYGLWYLHDSTHLNRSRMLLGTSCAVNGTGFGFTRQLLQHMGGWNYFTLTEDIEFSTWCATHGIRIGYCHDAILYDEQPTGFRQSWRQRTRWIQGGLQVSVKYAKNLLKGLWKGGRTAYASFETATLSLWGYGMSALSCGLAFLVTFLAERWLGLFQALLLGFLGSYGTLLIIGTLTLVTEWHRIRAKTRQKIGSVFAFPLFMLSYLPIAVTAIFRKFQWQPIHHTIAISAGELQEQQKSGK